MNTTLRALKDLATAKHTQGSLPAGFDPTTHPVLARHFFGVEPFPINRIAAEVVAGVRFRHQVLRLHRLDPRVTAELLAEIGAERSITTIINTKLDRYVGLDPEALEATGGDQFWPAPLREV